MAALMASQGRAVICRAHTMRSLLPRIRTMSSHDSKPTAENIFHEPGDQEAKRVWPDIEQVSFDPYDQMRFPLPGNMGPALFHNQTHPPLATPKPNDKIDILETRSRYQNQAEVIKQYNMQKDTMSDKERSEGLQSLDVEIRVQDCPKLVRRDFQTLFPGSDVMTGDFTVVSLCQRTESDMTGWSANVEEEREKLMQLYSEAANELCSTLRSAGFWADFIDPCSGKPHIGPHTTDTMFETDERYRHFGFEIEDLGCCKVIKHQRWGTKSFVGCIFTNAPVDAPVLMELTEFAATDNDLK